MIKLYVPEDGAEEIRALDHLAVSDLTRVEVASALWRKHRDDEIAQPDVHLLTSALAADLGESSAQRQRLTPLQLSLPLLKLAAALPGVHRLRAADAIQLASAVAMRDADPSCRRFACFDRDLRHAAAAEGFALVPASL